MSHLELGSLPTPFVGRQPREGSNFTGNLDHLKATPTRNLLTGAGTEMSKVDLQIKEIAAALKAAFDQIEKYPGSVTSQQCEELRRQVSLIDYYHRYGGRQPWVSMTKVIIAQRKCSDKNCDVTDTLYLIDGIPYCLAHIPTPITFPIGLHGDNYKAYKARTSG